MIVGLLSMLSSTAPTSAMMPPMNDSSTSWTRPRRKRRSRSSASSRICTPSRPPSRALLIRSTRRGSRRITDVSEIASSIREALIRP
ncbi:hypothetical protein [Streptomyces sp. NPDC059604]|uniref:hypothetical protein n=1 Tax=Streptomyces sp. NPDC059604 TaxID=3346881 RepID=UPI0036A8DB18